MTTNQATKDKRWWLREAVGIAFKLHPVVLLALGLLNANEAFLVLVVSYLAAGVISLLRSTFILGYDLFILRFPSLPSIVGKVSETVMYLLGWGFMLLTSGFLLLLFFANMYDTVDRQDYEHTVFGDADGAVLERTLIINASWFLLMELIQLMRYIRSYRPSEHDVINAYSFNFSLQKGKWTVFPLVWLFVFYPFFLFMSMGMAFRAAIFSFFVFDIGFVFLKRLAEGKKPV